MLRKDGHVMHQFSWTGILLEFFFPENSSMQQITLTWTQLYGISLIFFLSRVHVVLLHASSLVLSLTHLFCFPPVSRVIFPAASGDLVGSWRYSFTITANDMVPPGSASLLDPQRNRKAHYLRKRKPHLNSISFVEQAPFGGRLAICRMSRLHNLEIDWE